MKKTIAFYPAIHDQNDHADLLARMTWHLWPWRARIAAIKLWSPPQPNTIGAAALGFDPAIDSQYAEVRALIETHTAENDEAAKAALITAPCDLLYVWRAPRSRAERSDLAALRQAVETKGGLVYVVDTTATQYEGSFYLWGCYNALGDKTAYIGECQRKFAALKTRPRRDRVYVFGTGPSLDLVEQLDLTDGDAIVCNSIVANEKLLDQVKPFAIVAGDPIFHAGCSQYAAEFRAKLRQALETRDIVFVTVMRDYVQHLAQLPEHLHDRVIAIPFAPDKKTFRYDLDHDFRLSPEGNVLMLLLLPLAAALYDHISVCGCDGRPVSENAYFWRHHQSSQLSGDKMQNIQRIHPAFFERSYDDHYAAHVADLARVVDNLEDDGKRIDSVTPSHIPALTARQTWAVREKAYPDAKPALLVSVNPDATDQYGHWLGYDRRMAAEAERRGVAFMALGNQKLTDALIAQEGHIRRAFTYETWGAGNQPLQSISLPRMREFEESLRRQVAAIAREKPGHERVYYLYTGSLPHALAMYRVARDHPEDAFVVNTFWTSTMDCEADDYLKKWAKFLRAAPAQANLRIFALTRQLRAIIANHTGVHLPLMPHPNPSMTRPPAPASRADAGGFNVLFPGGMTEEKGFRDIPAILQAMRRTPALDDARFTVRATRAAGALDKDKDNTFQSIAIMADTVDAVMDDDAFLAWLTTADVAVLPYRPAHWRYRNSALAIDLLYLGVPILCCKGTWIADVLEKNGGGGIAIDSADPNAYAEAVAAIRANLGAYRAAARAAARSYHASNSWPALVDSVLAVAAAPRAASGAGDADRLAPIDWRASAAPERIIPPQPPSRLRRFASFAAFQLTRSRRVMALGAGGVALIAAAFSGLGALEPIRAHLGVLGLLAIATGAAAIVFRFLLENAEAVRARIDGRSAALGDAVASLGHVLAARGVVKRLALGVIGVFAALWLVAYALRLSGVLSQLWVDIAFWGGGGLALLGAGALLGAQTTLHTARRLMERMRAQNAIDAAERARAAAVQSAYDMRQALSALSATISAELKQITDAHTTALTAEAAKTIGHGAEVLKALDPLLRETADAKRRQLALEVASRRTHRTVAHVQALMTTLSEVHERGIEALTESQHAFLAAMKEMSAAADADQTARIAAAERTLQASIASAQAELQAEVRQALAGRQAIDAQVSAVARQAVEQSAVVKDLSKAVNQLGEDVRVVSTGGFQSFPRHLDKAEQQELASALSKALNLSITGHNLNYMAHQVRELEARGLGRIAAPASDVLVRTAALLAVNRKDPAVLEIGTLFGLGAAAMWTIARPRFERVTLTLIDPLNGYYGDDYTPTENDIITGIPVIRQTLDHNLRTAGIPDDEAHVIQHLSQSAEAQAEAAARRYDVLIIDGDHSYEGARRDFVNYAPLVREGGFIIFDDYEVDIWQGVTDCANDLMAQEKNLARVLHHGRTLVCQVTGPLLMAAAARAAPAAAAEAARG